MSVLANLFGYVLNYLYIYVQNYGLAIILFSVLLKLIMLPLTIKQQTSLKKNNKVQEEIKKTRFSVKLDIPLIMHIYKLRII